VWYRGSFKHNGSVPTLDDWWPSPRPGRVRAYGFQSVRC